MAFGFMIGEVNVSRTPGSLISEEYSQASRLKMTAVSSSPREQESEASFSGRARLQTAYRRRSLYNQSLELSTEEILAGDYEVKRKIILSGAARYDFPHLYIRKDGWRIKDVAGYMISICNDGNAALGPLFLQDLFPEGASFINATLRPNQIGGNSSNWTILHLAVGDTLRIGINLDVENCAGDIINRARVAGNYSGGQVLAQNVSVLDHSSLGCSPVQGMTGSLEPLEYHAACACLVEEAANETDFLDPMDIAMQWDIGEKGETKGEASCPLSCPALEEALSSGQR